MLFVIRLRLNFALAEGGGMTCLRRISSLAEGGGMSSVQLNVAFAEGGGITSLRDGLMPPGWVTGHDG